MLGKGWDDSRMVINKTLAYTTDVHMSTTRIEDASVRNCPVGMSGNASILVQSTGLIFFLYSLHKSHMFLNKN